jgi:hypothetical protein
VRPLHGRKFCGLTLLRLPLLSYIRPESPRARAKVSDIWYYADQRGQKGPLTFPALKEALATLQNATDVHVWREGFPAWKKAEDVVELNTKTAVPPLLPNAQTTDEHTKTPASPPRRKLVGVRDQRVIFLPLIYFLAALAFGIFVQMQKPFATLGNLANWYDVGVVLGIALPAFVIPGMGALVVWAFLRFSRERTAGPLVTWFALLLVYCAFMGLGAMVNSRI